MRELAFLLAVKRRTSTIKGKNLSCVHYALGEICGCSPSTARRHLDNIIKLGGATIRKSNGYVYVEFGRVRARKVKNEKNGMWWSPRYSDVILNEGNTTFKSYKDIELALRALYIVDRQRVRNFFTQTMKIVGNPDCGVSAKEIKSARKRLHRYGLEGFVDRGMSNKFLRGRLHCGTAKLKDAVAYGETIGLFTRILPTVEFIHVGRGLGHEALDYTDDFTFATYSYAAIVDGATRYALI